MVTSLIAGFCCDEVNPFGPTHEYELPPLEEKLNVVPAQTGLLLEAVGTGLGLTLTEVMAVAEQPEELVTVTV